MTTLNLACSICSEDYGSNDEVLSTYCGHIFHNSCFQFWKSRSKSCPECRVENVQTHKIYMHLGSDGERQMSSERQDDMESYSIQLEHLLWENEDGLKKLQRELSEMKSEILVLRTEYERETAEKQMLLEETVKLKFQLKENENILADLVEVKSKGGSFSRRFLSLQK